MFVSLPQLVIKWLSSRTRFLGSGYLAGPSLFESGLWRDPIIWEMVIWQDPIFGGCGYLGTGL